MDKSKVLAHDVKDYERRFLWKAMTEATKSW